MSLQFDLKEIPNIDWAKAIAQGKAPNIPLYLVYSRIYDAIDLMSVYQYKN